MEQIRMTSFFHRSIFSLIHIFGLIFTHHYYKRSIISDFFGTISPFGEFHPWVAEHLRKKDDRQKSSLHNGHVRRNLQFKHTNEMTTLSMYNCCKFEKV